jgi:hypothetical protein
LETEPVSAVKSNFYTTTVAFLTFRVIFRKSHHSTHLAVVFIKASKLVLAIVCMAYFAPESHTSILVAAPKSQVFCKAGLIAETMLAVETNGFGLLSKQLAVKHAR